MLKDKIKIARDNDDIVLIKNIFPLVPSWNEIINLIDYNLSEEYISDGIRSEPIGINDSMYIRISDTVNLKTQSSIKNIIPQMDAIIKYLNNEIDKDCIYGECYINFSSNTSVKPPHNDPWMSIAWGCIGRMEWRIYKSRSDVENYKSYIVEPGDIIIVPMDVLHSVIPMEPRASLTFAYKADI